MALEQVNYSQVCTFRPPGPMWSMGISGGNLAGPWAGAFVNYSYVAVSIANAQQVQPGDVFRLYTGTSLKEPTLFTVANVGVPGFGLENIFFLPPPAAQPQSGDTITSIPRPAQATWLGEIGHVTSMVRSYTCPGGPSSLSLLLRLPPETRTDALNPGRTVQAWRGGSCVWEGKLDEPAATADGWTVTAHGAGTYGEDFAAIYTTWNADDAVNQAITRGLRWVNNGIGKPSGIFLSQQQDSGSQTVGAHMDLLITGGGLLWQVTPGNASSLPAGAWNLQVSPFTQDANGNPTRAPDRILISNTPVPRTVAADINRLVIRYQATADVAATATAKAVPATFAVTTVQNTASVIQHGPMEYYLDVSSAGVMKLSAVQSIGRNILNRYIRASFSAPFTAAPGQVLNTAGTPVDLGCDEAGLVYQVMVTDGAYGGEVAPAPLVFMSGAYEYNEDNLTATITPFQNARADMASLIAQLYPAKF